ncbi:MAG: PqqD family peptide modification chaperone [Anaerolineales bacterium]
MTSSETRLAPNREGVAAKVMDGEAIMINLANGMYYSMDQAGGLVWELIEAGLTLGEIAKTVSQHYEVTLDQALQDIQHLVEELLAEDLVKERTDRTSLEHVLPEASQQPLPYEPPKLNVYRDMAELLALDPPVPGVGDELWADPSE